MDSKILRGQNFTTPKPIDNKFSVGDYDANDSPHTKIENDRPIGGMPAYA